jgi:hypothetical protein
MPLLLKAIFKVVRGNPRGKESQVENEKRLKRLFFITIFVIIGLCTSILSAGQSSDNYSIDTEVLSGGGGECSSAGYYLWHTTGQPSAIGESASTNYRNYGGFWYTLPQPQEGCYWLGDINCDETVDISDVILVLRIALQLDSQKPCSDINNESGVDISDVILTLRMALGLDEWRPC